MFLSKKDPVQEIVRDFFVYVRNYDFLCFRKCDRAHLKILFFGHGLLPEPKPESSKMLYHLRGFLRLWGLPSEDHKTL